MNSALLATKLRIPPLPRQTVHRARLVAALEQGVPEHKLTLLSAPAGYGKSTLLAQWGRASRVRVAWVALGREENDPDRFLRSLLTAWESAQPGIRESALGLLLGAMAPDRDAVLAAFVNVGNATPEQTAFVLDDAHLIAEPSIHEALTFLLDHLPPTLHVVLAGREEPPLPLARYRARRELLELRSGDLHFRVDETGEFLNDLLGLGLDDDAIARLHDHLEGWPAGIHLASLGLRQGQAADALAISGRHRFIADYLGEDVLVNLPEETRRFLLQTSILDRLCGSLCDAVTGGEAGQETLERLERENLFLVPLDDDREWFRYHRLFADVLRAELRRRYPDEVAALHRRAAAWYLQHDLADAAFRHALDGDDPALAIQILERHESEKLHGGELRVLQGWLDAIPPAWHAAYPQLGLVRAGVLMFIGALDDCVRCIDDVERRLASAASDEGRRQRAKVTAFRCFVACFQNDLEQAERHAAAALRELRDEDRAFRADVYHALGETYGRNGRWEEARAHYLKALDFSQGPGHHLRAAHVYGALADLDLRQGRLRDAAGHWRKALAAVEEPANWGRLPRPVIGWVYLRLAEIEYERNALAPAGDHLRRGLEHAEAGGDVRALIAGNLLASRMHLTAGDHEAAAAALERARPLLEQASFPEWSGRFDRYQIELWLAQDRLRSAVDWADRRQRDGIFAEGPESERARLALARVLIVKGDRPACERALTLLAHLLRAATAEGRKGIQIEALALRALVEWQGGDRAGAMVSLERAMRLAEPEGYVRLFVDLGLPMARLLQEALARDVMTEYARLLLDALAPDVARDEGYLAPLPDPLSDREREVLGLMAAGLTNREIAEKLFISAETVKKHSGSIYAKLGVGHRTQAVARARNLGILGDAR